MENDLLIAMFREETTGSILGYAHVGEEFCQFSAEFPHLRFLLAYKSMFPGLESIPRFSKATLTKYPELKIALATLDNREKERRSGSLGDAFVEKLANRIVAEAIKAKVEGEKK